MSFEHISSPMTRVIDKLSDAYCIRLLKAMRRHDFDVADLVEREDRPRLTIERCLQRAKEIELRKKLRGVKTETAA